MDKKSHRQPHHEDGPGHGIHYAHSPYWKRAHYDWRFWIVVLLMLVAMLTYVMHGGSGIGVHAFPQRLPSERGTHQIKGLRTHKSHPP
jgi:hypothetical protein